MKKKEAFLFVPIFLPRVDSFDVNSRENFARTRACLSKEEMIFSPCHGVARGSLLSARERIEKFDSLLERLLPSEVLFSFAIQWRWGAKGESSARLLDSGETWFYFDRSVEISISRLA